MRYRINADVSQKCNLHCLSVDLLLDVGQTCGWAPASVSSVPCSHVVTASSEQRPTEICANSHNSTSIVIFILFITKIIRKVP